MDSVVNHGVLSYTEGLPIQREQDDHGPKKLVIEYINELPDHRSDDVIEIGAPRQLPAGEGGAD